MNTRLVPPNITPNWTPGPERVGLLTVETVKGSGKYYEKRNWYVQGDSEAAANFRFFAASPAMAEALASLISTYGMPDSGTFEPEEPLWEAARASLLAAGYQFAPSDPVY